MNKNAKYFKYLCIEIKSAPKAKRKNFENDLRESLKEIFCNVDPRCRANQYELHLSESVANFFEQLILQGKIIKIDKSFSINNINFQ